ncbi:cytochrome P450 [Dactylosporangium sp. CA-092794]|uniref:cytochrome P450 n=1 Tax=Dactylosporangium sp. CA-092794 TaxID=3239929 RepID=UPI003D90BB3C
MSWQRPVEWPLPQEFEGFWAVTRHRDIVQISKDSETFRSGDSVVFEPIPPDIARVSAFFLAMDAPEHTRLRKLIAAAFSPRHIAKISESIQRNAREIVEEFATMPDPDIVQDLSRKLPERTFFDMIGVPMDDRERVGNLVNVVTGHAVRDANEDPIERLLRFNRDLREYGAELAARRRVEPADDVMTSLAAAELDGQRLSDDEMGAAMVLLAVAGNDTTRQTTSHAVKALSDNPDQLAWLREDLDGRLQGAVEEFIRWATPIIQFARVASRDCQVGEQMIRRGEKVVMVYSSGNRDESVFADPYTFDLTRTPNLHVGFGGGGIHYCLGAPVARAQLRALFRELLHKVPRLEVGEPTYASTTLVNAVAAMPAHNPDASH